MSARLDRAGLAALVRPRIAALVLVSTAMGYLLEQPDSFAALPWALLGTLLVAGAGCSLNHFLEREADARMERTRLRPLVTGALTERQVSWGGGIAAALGLALLLFGAGPGAAGLQALALVVYLCIYTPLKKRTCSNTWVGALPGALPLLAGAAAAGGPGRLALIAFALIFLWQLPHFFAIASIYREQYTAGGMRMLSGEDPDDALLRWQMPMQVMSVMLVSILPVLLGPARALYFATALVVGLAFLAVAFAFRRHPDRTRARRVVLASVVYLPVVLAALVVDVGCRGHVDVDGDSAALADGRATADAECCEEPDVAASEDGQDGALPGSLASLVGRQAPPAVEDGTGLPNHGDLPDFNLVADDGTAFTRESLKGQVWVVDFIFTRCSGPCVAMAQAYRALQQEHLPARFLSVTVDPAHDQPEVLTGYRKQWGAKADEWRLLTGGSQAIQDLAEGGFRLPVNAGTEEVAGMGPMFHSGKFALVDAAGRVRGYYDYRDALELKALREDVRKLAAAAGS